MKKTRLQIIIVLALGAALLLAGCDMLLNNFSGAETPYATLTEDGRETGGYVDGRIGDTLTTAYFTFSVDNAYLSNSYAGQSPEAGLCYLVSEITIKNTTGEELPMFSSDFQVQIDDDEDFYDFPIEAVSSEMVPEVYNLKKGETRTVTHVFEVPETTQETGYSISFLEIYDDGLEGNVFFVYFDLDPQNLITL